MQGTMHVRSLVRLFIGAALLCLAWVVLTSGHASAAERPAPSQALSGVAVALPDLAGVLPVLDGDGVEDVLGDVLGTSSASGRRPATHPAKPTARHTPPKAKANEKRSGTTTYIARRAAVPTPVAPISSSVVPVVDLVGTTTRSTLDTGLGVVTEVAAVSGSVPVIGGPLEQVTDAVVSLVRALPEGVDPLPVVSLPVGDGTPTGVQPRPEPAPEVAAARGPLTAEAADTNDFRGRATTTNVGLTPTRHQVSDRAESSTVPSGPGVPADLGAPLDSAPALPGQPSPTGGAAQGAGDPATASAPVVLPAPSLFGRSSADWRVPRGLPAQPGTRPD
jgi:hypothetical protein